MCVLQASVWDWIDIAQVAQQVWLVPGVAGKTRIHNPLLQRG
jgi:hypothetical protein